MSNFTVNPKYITKTNDQIIEIIKEKLKDKKSIASTGQEKEYKIKSVSSTFIKYTGENRNSEKLENISFDNIKISLTILKKLKEFNTNSSTLKEEIPSAIYRKRSTLFAILLATNIIIKA
ncbi:MAG: hypothetical protein K8S16_06955 [Bacteroidales bacterium]|nr:hypothetical protein [Bacteroidales bacterium]